MKLLTGTLLIVLGLVIASQIEDVSAQSEVSDANSPEFRWSPRVKRQIITLPIRIATSILKIPLNIIKLPISIISKVVKAVVRLLLIIENIKMEVIAEIIRLVKHVIAGVVSLLVDIGVLQGKTTEEVINSVRNLITNILKFALSVEMTISSSIVNGIELIIDGLDIKGIINTILNLPVVKQIAELIRGVKDFIYDNFQTQIDDVKDFIKAQFEKHKNFFQPIFDGISSRILIITNALHALVNGDLSACPGETSPDKSPTGSLQWQLNILIDKIKRNIFSLLGLTGLVNKYQEKLEELETTVPPSFLNPTTWPPILQTLAGTTSPPFGSVS